MHGLNDAAVHRKTYDLFDRQADTLCWLGRVVGSRSDATGLLAQHHMTPIALISRVRSKADDVFPIVSLKAGLFGEFPATGADGIGILLLDAPGGQFERPFA